jgi:hypothetical protein
MNMKTANPGLQRLRNKSQNTRKNLPAKSSRRRGESNFLRAFERAYFSRIRNIGIATGEFSIHGYGIADLVWISWVAPESEEEFTALSLERQLSRRRLFAFEAKLKDWRRALKQAFRYRYFADKAIVVMPLANASIAIANLDAFRHLEVGLWTFDPKAENIREYFTPKKLRALNSLARKKAISLISSNINFRKFREEPNAVS